MMMMRTRARAPGGADGFVGANVGTIVARELMVFRRVWRSVAFGSLLEPVLLFVTFGFGFGALVAEVAGLSYLEFMATGTVGVGVLFSSMFPGLINGYFRRKETHLYDGLLAAPVSVAELVTGEAVWNGLRVTVVAACTLMVAAAFGVRMHASVAAAPLVALVSGFGFACAGAALASRLRTTYGFDFVIVGIITPLYVVAGTFFPVDGLPWWGAAFARVNPLYHTVELLRGLAFGGPTPMTMSGHAAAVVAFAALAWWVAVRLVGDALVD